MQIPSKSLINNKTIHHIQANRTQQLEIYFLLFFDKNQHKNLTEIKFN